jgi:hypothetical protein
MLTFSQTPANVFKIDYDNIVTNENMWKVLKYHIPTEKVWYDRKGKTLVRKTGREAAATPRVKASGVAPGTRKSVKMKTAAPQPRKVSKSTTIPKAIVMPRGDRASTVLAKVLEPENGSTGVYGQKTPTSSIPTAPLEPVQLPNVSVEAVEKEAPIASPENRPAGLAPAPGSVVIEIGDDPEESGMEASLVPVAAKRKGREKVQGSLKKARFASDPLEYVLTRATEVELLFSRPHFILPTVMVKQDVPAKPFLPDSATLVASTTEEPLGQSPVEETEVCLASDASLVYGDQPPVDFQTSLEPENGLGTGDFVVEESQGHPEIGAADLLEPGGGGLDQTEALDSPEAERPE